MILTEENKYYEINCENAVWASDEHHTLYQKNANVLKDVDWLIETTDSILIVEYKNGKVYRHEESFNPLKDKYVDGVAKKFYDSLHYLTLLGKHKKNKYIYIVEYDNDDGVSRRLLRNRIKKKLPFKLQETVSDTIKLIESFQVFTIDEWNENYPDFPVRRTNKPLKVYSSEHSKK